MFNNKVEKKVQHKCIYIFIYLQKYIFIFRGKINNNKQ